MRRVITLTLLLFASFAQSADFDKGFNAYNQGDFKTAYSEWSPLAEQGDANAQSNLALMYLDGQGVAQDDKQAVYWYRKASEQGLAFAQSELGFMYFNGQGVDQDNQQAVYWFRKA
ncbi:tetratricopeptide repeat protein, partial [Vibrio splendidus]